MSLPAGIIWTGFNFIYTRFMADFAVSKNEKDVNKYSYVLRLFQKKA